MIMILRMIAEARAQLTNHSQANILKWQIEEKAWSIIFFVGENILVTGVYLSEIFLKIHSKANLSGKLKKRHDLSFPLTGRRCQGGKTFGSLTNVFGVMFNTAFSLQKTGDWKHLARTPKTYHHVTIWPMHLVDIGQKSNDWLEHEDQHQQDCVLWTRIVNSLNIRIKKIKIHLIIPKPGDSDSQEQRPCSWTAPRPS